MAHVIKEFESVIELLEELEREGITGYRKQEVYKRYLNFRARMLGKVCNGSFELTPLCNFECKMCYVHLSKGQMEQEAKLLTVQQWKEIMDRAIDAGMIHADLTGGECLSYPGFQELYLHLCSRGVEVAVLTNGQLLTDEIADFFEKYPPSVVQVTLYGSNEDAYEAVTGRRAFADVCAAIGRLKKRNIRLLLTVTPNRFMQKDTHALLEFIRAQKVRYGIGTGSLPARPNTGRRLEDYAPEVDLYVRLHKDEQDYRSGVGKADSVVMEYVPTGFHVDSRLPCSAGVCGFHINWKGEMTPCIPFQTIHRSVLEHGFDNCWAWIRDKMTMYAPPPECNNCKQQAICMSCPAERTMGILNGSVNRSVCERTEQYVRAGILHLPSEHDCI